jgi:hypothetical protein
MQGRDTPVTRIFQCVGYVLVCRAFPDGLPSLRAAARWDRFEPIVRSTDGMNAADRVLRDKTH